MKILKIIIAALFSVTLGLVFIYSGYSKIDPVIETFEFTFVDIGIANWYTAPLIARILIGLEFFIGILLIVNYNLKKFTLPLMTGLLLFFIIYLLIQIKTSGNNGNCGCFGERLHMTPLQAVYKNIIMIAMGVVVYFLFDGWKLKANKFLLSFVAVTSISVPFILNPVDYKYTSNNLDEKVNYPLELNLLYQPEDSVKVEIPKIDLRKEKQVVAFISLTCPHCRIAAKKFRLIKKNNPDLPIYFILNGEKQDYKIFIEDTKADNIPNSFCLGKSFVQLAGTNLPRIYYLENSIVVKKVDYYELNQYDIEDWISKGKLE
ncbi:MAG: DoxX family protein [Bacteroidota bacterium]|nr:DoxX family protein [Bacteroidota bacterium]